MSPLFLLSSLLLAVSVLLLLPSTTKASGCHGMSKFRLAPALQRSTTTAAKKAQRDSSVEDKNKLCQVEYGEDAKMMDLEQMEGEFRNPNDLQHALNPLFQDNPNRIYYVANHGMDHNNDGNDDNEDGKYILKAELNSTDPVIGTRVAGQIFLELDDAAAEAPTEDDAQILCYIPKPKYTSTTMTMSSSSTNQSSSSSSSSSSSWMVPVLSVVAVGALGLAALQTYKANKAIQASNTISGGPSLDLGGTYSMLSSSENDLAQQLAPSGDTELV